MTKSYKNKESWIKPGPVVILFVMFVATIFMTIDVATSGSEMSVLARERSLLSEENRKLTEAIIKQTAISSIDKDSESLGFVKPEKTVYLTVEDVSSAYVR